jgi:TonB-linked SusC/RagA family outer membrane protein
MAAPLAVASAQLQERHITGQVVEAASGAPVSEAAVQVRGRGFVIRTDSRGQFSLRVAMGAAVLVVRRPGFREVEATVPSDSVRIRIEITPSVRNMDEVVVTGHASGMTRRHLASSVTTVGADDLTRASTVSIEHALQGKASGVQISQRTGAPGGGNTVRIRGSSTILGNSNPLYVVDGVIASDARVSNGQNIVSRAGGRAIASVTQDSPVNRIADLDPNEIETIEILRGSSAAAIYGSKASNGVVLITTRRGSAGAPRYTLSSGIGTSSLAYRNGQRRFRSLEDAIEAFGPTAAQYYDSTVFIDYEDLAYGEHPVNADIAMNVSGGSDQTRYFLSASGRKERGIVRNTFANKFAMRANLDQRLGSRTELQLNLAALRTANDRGLFGNDNNGSSVAYTLGWTPSFLDLRQRADGTWPDHPWYPSNPLQTIDLVQVEEGVWRGMMSTRMSSQLLQTGAHEFRFVGLGGVDFSSTRDEIYSPPALQYEPLDGMAGTASTSENRAFEGTLNLNFVHVWSGPALTLTSQLGTQYERSAGSELRVSGENLRGGLIAAGAGTVPPLVQDVRRLVHDFGTFAQMEVLWADRVLVTAGVRADRSSANAEEARFFYYPKASASYRVTGPLRGVNELKLRLAYGETGNRPGYGDKFTSLAAPVIGGATGFLPATFRPASNLRPERQQEIETGVDALLFSSRVVADLTVFRRDISNMLVNRTPAPSTGYATEGVNGADMRTWGVETSIMTTPVLTESVSWTSRLSFGLNRGKVTRLPVPSFDLGSPGGVQARIEVGKPPTQIIGLDTLPEPGRKIITAVLGDGNPRWTGGWSNEVRWRDLSLYALIDHQEGGLLQSGTFGQYLAARNWRDYDVALDDGRKLGDVLASARVSRIATQDATYTKLRELSVSYELPRVLLTRLSLDRAQRAQVRLSGRNLIWWTKFRGGDPEAENFGGGGPPAPPAVQRNRELGAYPSSRSFWLTLVLDF